MITLAPALGAVTRRTSQRLMGLLLAGAIAFAGLTAATPARSDSTEDLMRFLFGFTALAIIIGAVDDNHTPHYQGRWVLPDSCLETARVNHRQVPIYNARCLRRAGYDNLPNYCAVSLRTHGGHRRGFLAQCLHEAGYRGQSRNWSGWQADPFWNGHPYDNDWHDVPRVDPHPRGHDHLGWLPSTCEMTYRQSGHRVEGYDGRCLARNGFGNLPRRCRVSDAAGNHYFNAGCLRDAGYRTGRR